VSVSVPALDLVSVLASVSVPASGLVWVLASVTALDLVSAPAKGRQRDPRHDRGHNPTQ
jgi:hypothetical protein